MLISNMIIQDPNCVMKSNRVYLASVQTFLVILRAIENSIAENNQNKIQHTKDTYYG